MSKLTELLAPVNIEDTTTTVTKTMTDSIQNYDFVVIYIQGIPTSIASIGNPITLPVSVINQKGYAANAYCGRLTITSNAYVDYQLGFSSASVISIMRSVTTGGSSYGLKLSVYGIKF